MTKQEIEKIGGLFGEDIYMRTGINKDLKELIQNWLKRGTERKDIKQTLLEKIEKIYEEVFNSSDFNERQPEYELLIRIKKIIKETMCCHRHKKIAMSKKGL